MSDDLNLGAEQADGADGQEGQGAGVDQATGESDVGQSVTQQLDQEKERYLRLAAEYENYRKRTTRERIEERNRAQGELVKRLIDSLDDLSRVVGADPNNVDAKTLHDATAVVAKKLLKELNGAGLEILNPVDQTFNPAMHEAVSTEPALSREDDHVVSQVYQPGYVFNGQLLRPARVVVRQWNG